MIPYTQRDWIQLLISSRGSLSPGVLRRVVVFGVIAAVTWGLHRYSSRFALSVGLYDVAGAVIALILAFRTNTAYNRFWEGRILWGRIVNAARSLTRMVDAHAGLEPERARDFAVWVVVFAHTSRRSLRKEQDQPEVARLLTPERFAALSAHPHPPLDAARELSSRLAELGRSGALDPMIVARAEALVVELVDCLGGCERILKTPTPLGYVLLLQRFMALYLATLPLALIGAVRAFTPLVTMMVAYPVLMIEALGRELDDPFGHESNDLPLTRICDTIERDLLGTSALSLIHGAIEVPGVED